jgi:hypothetical protein
MICWKRQFVFATGRHRLLLPVMFFVLVGTVSIEAREPYREFLNGLRLRGYHDVALEYIDRLAKRSDIPASFAETLDYERAVTLEMAAQATADPARSGALLDDAISRLRQFLGSHEDHQLAMAARFRLGAALAMRAELLANNLRWQEDPAEARQLAAKVRTMFDESREIYVARQQRLRDKLLQLPRHLDPVKDAGLIDLRERLRSLYVEVQLLKAGILQKKAETFPEESAERLETLRAAATEYRSMYKKYSSRNAGLYAGFYEGRCQQQAGDVDAALATYQELLDMPGAATSFFDLTTNVLKAALECWLDEDRKDYERASYYGQRWLEASCPEQLESSTAIEALALVAKANEMLADSQTAVADGAERHRRRAAELRQMVQELKAKLAEQERSNTSLLPRQSDGAGDG